MSCEKLALCPFYNDQMPIDSAIGRMYKKHYCEGDKSNCARYKVSTALGKEFVPDTLFPNMLEKAEYIIRTNTNK